MNKEDRKEGDPIEWSHEMNIDLIKSFMGDMHNFFVFCRTYYVFVDEGFARIDHLKKSDDYEELDKEARALFDSQNSKRESNTKMCDQIIAKGAPASIKDKEWLAKSEW